jgi:hypothetical protein
MKIKRSLHQSGQPLKNNKKAGQPLKNNKKPGEPFFF